MGAREEALLLLDEGNKLQSEGKTDEAIEKYRQSLELFPTADAHTYLGWMLSFKGELNQAIRHCRTAIELDPDFGNPYNDIGVYLMQQGKLSEAETWLRRALHAKRYEPRHFPHINLGRIYIARRQFGPAIAELRKACELAPNDTSAPQLLRELASRLDISLGPLPDSVKTLLS